MKNHHKFLFIAIFRVINAVAGFAAVSLLGGILSSSEIGQYHYILAYSAIISTMILTPLGSYWEAKVIKPNEFFLYIVIQLFQALSFMIVLLLFVVFFSDGYKLLVIISFGVVTYSSSNIIHQININLSQILSSSLSVLLPVSNLFLIYLFHSYLNVEINAFYWLLFIMTSNIMVIIIGIFVVYKKSSALSIKKLKNEFIDSFLDVFFRKRKFFISVFIITSLVWGQQQSFKILVGKFASLEYLGILAYCFSISIAAYSALDTIFNQVVLPKSLERIKGKVDNASKVNVWENKYYLLQFKVGLIILSSVIISSKLMLSYIADGKYQNYWLLVVIGAVIEFFKSNITAKYLILRLINTPGKAIIPNLLLCLFLSTSTFLLKFYDDLYTYPIIMIFSYIIVAMIFSMNIFTRRNYTSVLVTPLIKWVLVTIAFVSTSMYFQNENNTLIFLLSMSALILFFLHFFIKEKDDYL
ncbi:hypothetical protein AB6D10_00330 [Vibrio splendidus]